MLNDLTPAQVCQKAADMHYVIAFNNDHKIAGSGLPVYETSRRLFIASIRQAYGLTRLKAYRVYDVWCDCQEDIAYCVQYVKDNRESSAYSR
jgi:hypothetical protein